MSEQHGGVQDVREFWNVEPCGTQFVQGANDRRDFFEKFREHRYRSLYFIPELVPFASAAGKDLLEIGCGNGADGTRFAQQGAHYTGVDLTQAAVDATREHFGYLGLTGTFQIENAEQLTFRDQSFDLVYSNGVLHHTPNPQQAFDEVHRVLKPGGRAIIMLYHKNSLNYWVRILGLMRLRLLLKIFSRVGHWKEDRARHAGQRHLEIRGNQNPNLWEAHYTIFLERGWDYLRAENFVHRCTDGPACPIAYVYTRRSAGRAFERFRNVDFRVGHLPLRQHIGPWVPMWLERLLAKRIGWALMIYADK